MGNSEGVLYKPGRAAGAGGCQSMQPAWPQTALVGVISAPGSQESLQGPLQQLQARGFVEVFQSKSQEHQRAWKSKDWVMQRTIIQPQKWKLHLKMNTCKSDRWRGLKWMCFSGSPLGLFITALAGPVQQHCSSLLELHLLLLHTGLSHCCWCLKPHPSSVVFFLLPLYCCTLLFCQSSPHPPAFIYSGCFD